MEKHKIKSYKDLLVWQKAHELTKKVLKVCRNLPRTNESKIIANQLMNAVTSIPANIVEGYGGHRGKAFASYLKISRGSVTETDYWLYLLQDIGRIEKGTYKELSGNLEELIAILTSIITKL